MWKVFNEKPLTSSAKTKFVKTEKSLNRFNKHLIFIYLFLFISQHSMN